MTAFLSKCIAFILPYTCILCHARAKNKDLCQACANELPWLNHSCQQCALPLANDLETICGACQTNKIYYDHTIALFHYQDPIKQMVGQFKFHQKLIYGKLFADLLNEKLTAHTSPLPKLLIPVPLHASRLKERGYNQALELARPLAKQFSLPIDYQTLQRVRATEQQSLITADKRKANVKGAFILKRPLNVKHVGLIDDVMTTGHTVNECSKILKKSGVETVTVITIARA